MKFCVVLCVFLVGCASLQSEFQCGSSSPHECRSLSEVSASLDKKSRVINPDLKVQTLSPERLLLDSNSPSRVGEKILKIWFAPYVDKDGNYHRQHEIYSVVEKARWVND